MPPALDIDRGLAAAADALVLRALELIGKRLVRVDRSRFSRMGDLAFFEAHLLWQPDSEMLDKALAGAWDVLPRLIQDHAHPDVNPQEVRLTLDRYVRDLIRTKREHTSDELRYRLGAFT